MKRNRHPKSHAAWPLDPPLLGLFLRAAGESTAREYLAHVAITAEAGARALLEHEPASFDDDASSPTPYQTVLEMVATWHGGTRAKVLRRLNETCGDADVTLDSQEVYSALIEHAECGMFLGMALAYQMLQQAEHKAALAGVR